MAAIGSGGDRGHQVELARRGRAVQQAGDRALDPVPVGRDRLRAERGLHHGAAWCGPAGSCPGRKRLKVSRSTIAAQSRGSVKVWVQPLNDSLEAIATLALFLSFGQDPEQELGAAAVEFHVAQLIGSGRRRGSAGAAQCAGWATAGARVACPAGGVARREGCGGRRQPFPGLARRWPGRGRGTARMPRWFRHDPRWRAGPGAGRGPRPRRGGRRPGLPFVCASGQVLVPTLSGYYWMAGPGDASADVEAGPGRTDRHRGRRQAGRPADRRREPAGGSTAAHRPP